jgi:hypothetical protein
MLSNYDRVRYLSRRVVMNQLGEAYLSKQEMDREPTRRGWLSKWEMRHSPTRRVAALQLGEVSLSK